MGHNRWVALRHYLGSLQRSMVSLYMYLDQSSVGSMWSISRPDAMLILKKKKCLKSCKNATLLEHIFLVDDEMRVSQR